MKRFGLILCCTLFITACDTSLEFVSQPAATDDQQSGQTDSTGQQPDTSPPNQDNSDSSPNNGDAEQPVDSEEPINDGGGQPQDGNEQTDGAGSGGGSETEDGGAPPGSDSDNPQSGQEETDGDGSGENGQNPEQDGEGSTQQPGTEPDTPTKPDTPTSDDLPAGFTRWSNGQTWDGNLPADNATVTIKAGQKVWLDQDIKVKKLTIEGELHCAEQALAIHANVIMVHGKFICGTANKPHNQRLTITLTGAKPADLSKLGPMGDKVIGVMMGGELSLHGQERTSWLNLNATAAKGSTQIQVTEAPNWRAGDRLVITSTSQDYKQAETVQIESINGRNITLKQALNHRHFGEVQTYSNDEKTWDVNTRAEVGLLSRNIKVFGDAQSANAKYGGHIMVMANSKAYLSGIEMTRVGQYGIKGRYPFHWHLTGDVTGQYIKNSAIHDSYNRCITVHASYNASIENNVCFKHVGHGFFIEDGIETGNRFHRNLGLWTIRPPENDALIKSDFEVGPASQGPATFWISNGHNYFTENVAAGSDGLGYWYDTEDKVTGESASLPEAKGYVPRTSPFGEFKDNRVHSSRMALSICSRDSGRPGYQPQGNNGALIENLTVYYGGIGAIWPCNMYHRFKNMMVLDTGFGSGINSKKAAFVSAFPAFIDDSLFVSNSKLAGSNPVSRAAFGIYDFGTRITDSHFVNYSEDNAQSPLFVEVGGGVTFMYQSVKNITRQNSDLFLKVNGVNSKSTTGNVIRDLDGSLSGKSGIWSLVPKNDLMRDSQCITRSSADHGVMCPYYYAQISIKTGSINALPLVVVGRTDTDKTKNYQPHQARKFYKVFPPLDQSDYHHVVNFKDAFTSGKLKPLSKVTLQLDYALEGSTTMLALKNLKSTARINKTGWSKVTSLAALRSHSGRAWYQSGDTLHVKFKAAGTNKAYGSRDSVDIIF